MESLCACGTPATANGRECGSCFHGRLSTVRNGFTPTRGRNQIDPAKSRRWDNRLEDYRRVRMEGSQPRTTKRRDIDAAKRISDDRQESYRADRLGRKGE